ncbi:hypothetical protein Scep_015384 [Stephania cephalantha]|uniref:Protein CHUP1, chloroplastic n=1 Tax=Stephania cephalantha TaxID=152367 RepID=A0AAP0J355_9MAGN
MEGTARKSALMNPNLLKVGVPFAVALGALVYSVTRTGRRLEPEESSSSSSKGKTSCDENEMQEEFQNQESSQEQEEEEEEEKEGKLIRHAHVVNSSRTIGIRECYLEEEMLHLINKLKALQEREEDIEKRFIRYCNSKEQESVLMELQHMLALESAHVEFLNTMIKSAEDENQRLEVFLVEFLGAIEQIELARRENKFLKTKVKKLSRSMRQQSHLVSQQASTLQDREAELLAFHKELERREQIIKECQEEIVDLKRLADQLEKEKRELAEATSSAASTSKGESEKTMEDQNQVLLAELEQLKKARAADTDELIYLRWVNACLKHEFTRIQQEEQLYDHEMGDMGGHPNLVFVGQDENIEQKPDSDSDKLSAVSDRTELQTSMVTAGHKKHKLLKKLKKWVKGNEGCRRSSDAIEAKNASPRRLSTADGLTRKHASPRNSWASV